MTREIIEKIIFLIDENEPFVLATIFKYSGSVPRTAGTKMLVTKQSSIYGSVGGGLLEAKVIQLVPDVIEKNKTEIIHMNLASEQFGGMGMICGGNISVMLNPVIPEKNIKKTFQLCLNALKLGDEFVFVTIYDKNNFFTYHLASNIDNFVKLKDNSFLSDDEVKLIACKDYLGGFKAIESNDKVILCSTIFIPNKVYILGAGHVAQPTANIASMMGFDVIVMDDRRTFANRDRFPNVQKIKIINFHDPFHNLGKEAFIVIITRGHVHDKIVLEKALLTEASYIGMIGSLKKRDSIFEDLRKHGIDQEDIKRVHSPIGLDIGSETPEEIALSIVAEMVLVRAGGPKRCL